MNISYFKQEQIGPKWFSYFGVSVLSPVFRMCDAETTDKTTQFWLFLHQNYVLYHIDKMRT